LCGDLITLSFSIRIVLSENVGLITFLAVGFRVATLFTFVETVYVDVEDQAEHWVDHTDEAKHDVGWFVWRVVGGWDAVVKLAIRVIVALQKAVYCGVNEEEESKHLSPAPSTSTAVSNQRGYHEDKT
jgi:hypothetical protein